MGPRLASRGNMMRSAAGWSGPTASMGPRLASRGNNIGYSEIEIDLLLQWGRGSRAAETCS